MIDFASTSVQLIRYLTGIAGNAYYSAEYYNNAFQNTRMAGTGTG
jgi:hypothetical protein